MASEVDDVGLESLAYKAGVSVVLVTQHFAFHPSMPFSLLRILTPTYLRGGGGCLRPFLAAACLPEWLDGARAIPETSKAKAGRCFIPPRFITYEIPSSDIFVTPPPPSQQGLLRGNMRSFITRPAKRGGEEWTVTCRRRRCQRRRPFAQSARGHARPTLCRRKLHFSVRSDRFSFHFEQIRVDFHPQSYFAVDSSPRPSVRLSLSHESFKEEEEERGRAGGREASSHPGISRDRKRGKRLERRKSLAEKDGPSW